MRTFACSAVIFALCACEQTDPSAATKAGGAAGAAVEGAPAADLSDAANAKAGDGSVAPAPARDAVTGFNTGKRLYKPTSFASEGAASEAAVAPRDVNTGLANGRRTYKPDF